MVWLISMAMAMSMLFGTTQSDAAEPGTPLELGMFDPGAGQWHFQTADDEAASFAFGAPGDIPLLGDWDCDGTTTIGVFDPDSGRVQLRNNNEPGAADHTFYFGVGGDVPVVGDWDGNGCDTIAVYRPSRGLAYVSNTLTTAAASHDFYFGIPGDIPLAGDFDGDGVDSLGVFRNGFMYLRNDLSTGVAEHTFAFGIPSDEPFVGDFDGDGIDTVGVYRPSEGVIYRSNTNQQSFAAETIEFGGSGWVPLSGGVIEPLGDVTLPPPTTTTTTTVPSTTTTTVGSTTTTTVPATTTTTTAPPTTTTTAPTTTTTLPPEEPFNPPSGELGRIVDPRDFGAVGNGSADDTAALQAAVDFMMNPTNDATDGVLWLGNGEFVISDTIRISGGSITVLGTGWTNPPGYAGLNGGQGTSVRWKAGAGKKAMFEVRGAGGASFLNLRIEGNNNANDRPTAGIRFINTNGTNLIDGVWLGTWVWSYAGVRHGHLDNGVLVDGANGGNFQLTMSNSTVFGSANAGIKVLNAQSKANVISNVTFGENNYGISTNAHLQGANLFFDASTGADLHTQAAGAAPEINVQGFFSERSRKLLDINSKHARVFIQGGYMQLSSITGGYFADFTPAENGARLELRNIQFTQNTSNPKLRFKPGSSAGITNDPPGLVIWENVGLNLDAQLDVGLINAADKRVVLFFGTPDPGSVYTMDYLSNGEVLTLGRVRAWPAGYAMIGEGTDFDPPDTSALVEALVAVSGELVDVRSFGAVGDGVTDDTAAIQAAINHLLNTSNTGAGIRGGVLWMGEGDFRISNTLNIYRGAVTIVGAGWNHPNGYTSGVVSGSGTSISWKPGSGRKAMFQVRDSAGTRFLNLELDGNGSAGSAVNFHRLVEDQVGTNGFNYLDSVWTHGALDYGILVDGPNGNNDSLTVSNSVLAGAGIAGIRTPNTQSVWNHYENVVFFGNRYGISTDAHFSGFDLSFRASSGADIHTLGNQITAQMWIWGYTSTLASQLFDINTGHSQLYVEGGSASLSSISGPNFADWYPAHNWSRMELRDLQFTGNGGTKKLRIKPQSSAGFTGGQTYQAPGLTLWNTAGLNLGSQLDVGLIDTRDRRSLLFFNSGQPGAFTMDHITGSDAVTIGEVGVWPGSTGTASHAAWSSGFPQ